MVNIYFIKSIVYYRYGGFFYAIDAGRRERIGTKIYQICEAARRPYSAGGLFVRQPAAPEYETVSGQHPFPAAQKPLVWQSAATNGLFVRFENVELSHDEIMVMAEQGNPIMQQ